MPKRNIKLLSTFIIVLGAVLSLAWLVFLEYRILAPSPLITFIYNTARILIFILCLSVIVLSIINHVKRYTCITIVILVLVLFIILLQIGFTIFLSRRCWIFDWSFHAVLLTLTILAYTMSVTLLLIQIYSIIRKNKLLNKGVSNNEST